jgi:hypothetical protein
MNYLSNPNCKRVTLNIGVNNRVIGVNNGVTPVYGRFRAAVLSPTFTSGWEVS